MVNSDRRPVPLETHWVKYRDRGRANEVNDEKIDVAIRLVEEFPNDNFILFVHSKGGGRKLRDRLMDNGIETEFHCADLNKEERGRIEREFRSKELRVLVSTSTISMGINV
jgi:superfamily II helicase